MQNEESFPMVVILSNLILLRAFDLYFENSGCKAGLQAADHFLTSFLTGSIGEKSSNEAVSISNR